MKRHTPTLFVLFLGAALVLASCMQTGQLPGAAQPAAYPAVTPTSAPLSGADPADTRAVSTSQTYLLPALTGWDSIGFVRPGQQFEITASGSWSIDPGAAPSGPGGMDQLDPEAMLPDAPAGALIGRIGDNPPFLVGEHLSQTAQFGGPLQLSINDQADGLADNTGSLEVTLTLGDRPEAGTQLLTNSYDGYMLLYPSAYHAVLYDDGLCLTLAETTTLACHVASAFIEDREAGGQSLEQAADAVAGEANPDIPVERSSLVVAGVDAVLLDNIYAQDVLRKVVLVYGERIYTLTFVPWDDTMEDFDRLEQLYNTLILSFTFLPGAEQPPPSGPAPDLSTMSVRSLSSTSPDRQWQAEALLASFAVEAAGDYTRLTVSRMDGSASWIAYENLSANQGLGSGSLSALTWSADGRYLYAGHGAAADGCGYPFTTALHQVDLMEASLVEIPLTDMAFGEITLSAGAERMAYRTAEGILVHDLKTGARSTLSYAWPAGSAYVVGWHGWSPDGSVLAFGITEPLCDSAEPSRTSTFVINLESGSVRPPSVQDTWLYLPDQVSADPIPMAALALQDFLNALSRAGSAGQQEYTYEHAAAMYGGSYDTLIELNADIASGDHAALLRNACQVNGFQCLPLRSILSSSLRLEEGIPVVDFTVYLSTPQDGIFTLGACCGDESGLPQSRFHFSVRQFEDGTFRVLDLPPYVP